MSKQLFLIVLSYKKDLAEIDALMKTHVAYLKKYYKLKKFIVSGRQIPRTGGIIVCAAADFNEVEAIVKEDPFIKKKAAEYSITQFLASMCSADFTSLLNAL